MERHRPTLTDLPDDAARVVATVRRVGAISCAAAPIDRARNSKRSGCVAGLDAEVAERIAAAFAPRVQLRRRPVVVAFVDGLPAAGRARTARWRQGSSFPFGSSRRRSVDRLTSRAARDGAAGVACRHVGGGVGVTALRNSSAGTGGLAGLGVGGVAAPPTTAGIGFAAAASNRTGSSRAIGTGFGFWQHATPPCRDRRCRDSATTPCPTDASCRRRPQLAFTDIAESSRRTRRDDSTSRAIVSSSPRDLAAAGTGGRA